MKIIEYDIKKYRFEEDLQKVFSVSDISMLHIQRPDLLPDKKLTFENESKTDFHTAFYGALREGKLGDLEKKYLEFIKNEIRPFFSDSLAIQAFPTFRVHLPNDQAIHKWHYDSDSDHQHPEWEINIFIPITNAFDTQTLWLESVPGLRDFSPINLKYGQYVFFDGNRSMHGNKINVTTKCRVSFDFRVLPIEKLPANNLSSITSGRKFSIGDYYILVK